MTGKFLFAAALAALAGPAGAAVTVIGNTSARICYEAAEARVVPALQGLSYCDAALEENLGEHDHVATLVNRGILRLRRGMIAPAVADFDSAIARDPGQPEAYLNKGMALLRGADDWDGALSLFNRALEKGTRRPAMAYFGRAFAYEMTGRVKEAYLDYRAASRIEPKWNEPRLELARFTVRHP